jgi:phage recombination protein Bet
MSSELARVERAAVTDRTRAAWSDEQINLIASTVAEGASRAQLFMFLELAARYDLDPFAREIWCAVPKNQDGSARTDKVMIMVGRDGFLKIAQRHPDYRGMDSDVVKSGDDFTMERVDGDRRIISHKYGVERGKPVAAYSVVFREGRTPTYFYAAMEDFRPKGPSTMILKCAEAGALRRAFSISGIVAEEEVAKSMEAQTALEAPEPSGPPELVERVRALYEQARLFDPSSWTPAKERLQLAGASEGRLRELEAQLRAFIEGRGGVVAETVESVEEPDESPTDVGLSADAATEPAESLADEPSERLDPTSLEPDPYWPGNDPPEQSGLVDGEPEEGGPAYEAPGDDQGRLLDEQ